MANSVQQTLLGSEIDRFFRPNDRLGDRTGISHFIGKAQFDGILPCPYQTAEQVWVVFQPIPPALLDCVDELIMGMIKK